MLNNGELEIFFGATPNKGTYIIPDRQVNEDIIKDIWGDAFITYLETNSPHELLKVNTFKINDGFIDIEKKIYDYPYQGNNAYKISYLAVRILNKTLFYFVNSVNVMPQRIRLYIELDNWGTYIGGANIKNVRVVNTNLQINAGAGTLEPLYKLPDLSNGNQATQKNISAYGDNARLTLGDLVIVATIKYVKHSTYKNMVEVIDNFAFNVRWCAGLQENDTVYIGNIIKALGWVQSIFSCIIPGADTDEQDAQVINLYLLTNDFIQVPFSNTHIDMINFNGIRNEGQLNPDYKSKQNPGLKIGERTIYTKEIVIANNITYTPILEDYSIDDIINIDALGKSIYFGTLDMGIELPIFAGCIGCKFTILNQGDSLLIKVECNNKELDITEAFKVAGIANTGTLTYQQTISKAIGGLANLAGGAFQIASGGAGLVSGTAAVAKQLTDGYKQTGNGSYIGGGSGLLTMRNIGAGPQPAYKGDFLYLVIKGGENIAPSQGKSYLNQYGANCDYTIPNNYNLFTYITQSPYLTEQEGQNIKIIQCSCEVGNIPYNAAEEIEAKFNEGVRLIAISANV